MRRKGFTLIELLVVIAIIGILAAMLFPVFARARESARKTQCLSNVKNVALAVNMYLTDYEKLFPWGANKSEADYFNNVGGRPPWPNICNRAMKGNPYLREAVLLEDYIKNRDIWRCPSAKVMNGAMVIVPIGRDGYWLNAWIDGGSYVTDWHGADYDKSVLPCNWPFPSGWGGEVTNSFEQGIAQVDFRNYVTRGSSKVFMQGIACNDGPHWIPYTSIQDASRYVMVGDTGCFNVLWGSAQAAFPDKLCFGMCGTDPGCCGTADPDNCGWSATCGLTYEQKEMVHKDPVYAKTLTRHMGGVNLGFLDGHARWYSYREVLLRSVFDWKYEGPIDEPLIYGLYEQNPADWK